MASPETISWSVNSPSPAPEIPDERTSHLGLALDVVLELLLELLDDMLELLEMLELLGLLLDVTLELLLALLDVILELLLLALGSTDLSSNT